jgi:hypothetical protein
MACAARHDLSGHIGSSEEETSRIAATKQGEQQPENGEGSVDASARSVPVVQALGRLILPILPKLL